MSVSCFNSLYVYAQSLTCLIIMSVLCVSDVLATTSSEMNRPARPVYAIVIQESDYIYAWPNLSYQEEKVEILVKLLGRFGVDVQRYVNCTGREVVTAIDDFFRNRTDEHPLLLVIYFGHAYQDREGKSCLIASDVLLPTDWKGESVKGIIPFSQLVSTALKSRTDSVYFINSSVSLKSQTIRDLLGQEKKSVDLADTSCLVVAAGQQGEAIPAQSHFLDILIKELGKQKTLNKTINLSELCQLLVYKGLHNSWRMPWCKIYNFNQKNSDDQWLIQPAGKKAVHRAKLTVLTDSNDAVVRILNIKPKYKPSGMELSPGKYLVEVTSNDVTKTRWIRLVRGEHVFLSMPFKGLSLSPLQDIDASSSDKDDKNGGIEELGSKTLRGQYGFSLVKVEHGSFIMGGSRFNEGPKHHVLIKKDFFIMDREVSVELYDRFLKESGKEDVYDHGSALNYPVINVSWSDAVEFAGWLSRRTGKKFRLPTEEEWEYVARKRSQSFSPEMFKKLVPVDKAVANQLGVRGMLGNVWEWCANCWHQRYVLGSTRVKTTIDDCINRVIRGGSWRNNIRLISPASRNGISFKTRADNIGFRLIAE